MINNKICIVVQREKGKCKRKKQEKRKRTNAFFNIFILYTLSIFTYFFLDLRHFDITDFRY